MAAVSCRADTPFLIAVLTTDSDHVDFPKGAMLTITGPDGKRFGSARDDDKQLAIFGGKSLRGLISDSGRAVLRYGLMSLVTAKPSGL
jgi:hypothetical protein